MTSRVSIYRGWPEPPAPLDDDRPIDFELPSGIIRVEIVGDKLAISTPDGTLVIRPQVSNVALVEVDPR